MKRLAFILALLLPLAAQAQTSTTVAGRASVGVDYKIVKGLHVKAEEEVRSGDGFSSLGSLRTTVGLTYKPSKYVKLGVGYTLINPWKSSWNAFNAPRHRGYLDVTGYLPLGDFQFSLKERLQLTHRTGEFNVYQTTPNALALKSRIGVKYKGWRAVKPSIYFEVRTALNDPWGSMSGSQQTKKDGTTYYAYTPSGYTHLYNNRYRGNIGLDWNITKQHTLSPYVLLDYISEYEIDANSDGTRLFSAAYNEMFRVSLGIGYTFSF